MNSKSFEKLMAAEAHRKGFFEAPRRAFAGDGMKCNWTEQKKHFPTFTPIVDLLHAISYLHHAAMAIGGVIGDLEQWLEAQPAIEKETLETDPQRIVGGSLTYLRNNRVRMDYPSYRMAGLPIGSALMESLVKEINRRVKGTEKFWNDPSGANPILALKAASLCDDGRLEKLLAG